MKEEGSGQRFQRDTQYRRHEAEKEEKRKKKFHEVRASIALPRPVIRGGKPLWEVISQRRSRRQFTAEALSLSELSQLLWATQGVTGRVGPYALLAAPSAGALYPIDTYLVVNGVEGLTPGLYFYRVEKGELEKLVEEPLGQRLARAGLDQRMLATAGVVFCWAAVVNRSSQKYRQRAYRYIYMDAAHIAQNLYLACEALGLGCCTVGAFYDDEVNGLLGLDGEEETVLYMAAVGKG